MWCDPFLETAEVFIDLLSSDDVLERWDLPSALEGMDVSALAGHTARAVLTLTHYLNQPGTGDPMDAVAYLLTVSDEEDLESRFHEEIRSRAVAEAASGRDALAESAMQALTQLRTRLPATDRRMIVSVLGGMSIRLDEYVSTRLIELVVHLDDLAASLDRQPPQVSDDALAQVSNVLSTAANVKHGAWAVIRAFTRRERVPAWPMVL